MASVPEASGERDLADRRRFWSTYQPGFRFTDAPLGTPEFFRAVELHRYRMEPHICEMARFDTWAGRDVLEAGCGIATDGVQFARGGANYTGVDFSPTALELAERRFGLSGLPGRFVQRSLTELPFPDASFDLVYSNGVIHHTRDPRRAFAELARIVKPGGHLDLWLYPRRGRLWETIMPAARAVTVRLPPAVLSRLVYLLVPLLYVVPTWSRTSPAPTRGTSARR